MAGKVSSPYWVNRINKQNDVLFNKTVAEHNTQLAKYYKKAIKDTQADLGSLYDKILADSEAGELTVNSLYRYDRYFEVIGNLNKQLNKLGQKQINITETNLLNMYQYTSKIIYNNVPDAKALYNTYAVKNNAENVLKSIWCSDKKNWSDRVWSNTANLQKSIEKSMVDIVSRGASKDTLVKEIENRYNVDFNCADRLIRTETTYTQNIAAKDSYTNAGIEKYEFVAAMDDRTSDICEDLDGQIFRFDEAIVGENFPPCHPFAVALSYQ